MTHTNTQPLTDEDLFAFFKENGIEVATLTHAPTFTVDQGSEVKSKLPGGHSKNLFLKDKAGNCVLVSALAETTLRLNRLHKILGTGRLSFGSEALLYSTLGVRPGSVTAFSLINDPTHSVRFILDQALYDCDPLNFHPLRNDRTTSISRAGFEQFLGALGRPLECIDFSQLNSDTE